MTNPTEEDINDMQELSDKVSALVTEHAKKLEKRGEIRTIPFCSTLATIACSLLVIKARMLKGAGASQKDIMESFNICHLKTIERYEEKNKEDDSEKRGELT